MLQRTEEELSKFVTTHSMPEHRNLLLSGGLQLELAVHVTADFRAIVVVHVGCDSEAPSSGTRAQFLWCRV